MPRGKTLTIAPRKRARTTRKWKRKFAARPSRMLNKCYCKRFVIKATINGSDLIPSAGLAYGFSLNDVPGYTDFTNMFDQYQIAGVAYRFVVNRDQDSMTTPANQGYFMRIMHTIDHSDATTPTSFGELQQYPYVKEEWLSDSRPVTKWYFQKPAVLTTVNSVIANNYNPSYNKWIDTGYPGTVHYGLKLVYDNHYAGRSLFIECKYYVKLKEIR